jgi:hypothetical protein
LFVVCHTCRDENGDKKNVKNFDDISRKILS